MRPFCGLLLAMLLVTAAKAYVVYTDDSGIYTIYWPQGAIPMQIKLPTSPTLSDGTSYATSLVAAMDSWNAVLGVVHFTYTGQTTNTPINPPSGTYHNGNGINEIVMDSTIDGAAFGTNVLAITETYTSGDSIVEADIVINSVYNWDSYRGNLRAAEDIRRVTIHELGHVLGLDHPDQHGQTVNAIMNSIVSNIDTMQADDIAGVQLLYGALGVVPANDNFANATPIVLSASSIQQTGTNVAATKETSEPVIAGANAPSRHSVWWKWTAPSSGSITIDTLGSNFDTVLGVFTGSAVSSLTAVATNDDVQNGVIRTSAVTFNATGGTTYYIAVDGWGSTAEQDTFTYTGAITLNLSFSGSISTNTAPQITTQPSSQTVAAGSSVTFTVGITGTPPFGYQWQKDGSNLNDLGRISGVASATLTITNVQTSDAGSYRILVQNSIDEVTSTAASLTVNVAPAITLQPLSQTATVGNSVTFTAAASGTPVPTFQWQKNSVNINGATGSSYTIASVALGDAGIYTAVATNSVSSALSTGATLTVIPASNYAFLNKLFNQVLQRAPTPAELGTYNTSLTAGGSRADVLAALLNTATYQSREIESVIRMYFATFNRMPDYPGLLSWSETLRTGGSTLIQIGTAFANSAEFTTTYGSLNNTQFVQQLYRNVLGREAEPDGLNYWVGVLTGGAARGQVLTGFSESAEFQTDTAERVEIIRLHVLLYGRVPSDAELTSWLGFLHGDDQASVFLDSAEFLTRFPGGGTNDQFVQTAFSGILRRNADAGAIASFSPALTAGTMTRTQLIALLFNSSEAQSAALPVTRLYLASLRRGPDPSGLDIWTTYVNAGNSLLALAQGISSSPEFLARYGGLSNSDYVEALYLGVLGRTSDPDGLAYWTNQLDTSASSRADILIGFAQSAESIALFDTDVRTTLLSLALYDRLPTTDELALWHTYFATLTTQLREEFLESIEFNGQ